MPQPTGTRLITAFTRGLQGPPGTVTPEFLALRNEVTDAAEATAANALLTINTLKAIGLLDADGNPNTLLDDAGNVLTIE